MAKVTIGFNYNCIDAAINLRTSESQNRVLVLYVWANIDVQSLANLEFFVRHGMHELQQADYYIILQQVGGEIVNEFTLPILPPNAHYIQHENDCYDLGTFGWFFNQSIVQTSHYKYFILMNSSVRGPFLTTTLLNSGFWWYEHFIRRLSSRVKLVGPTISCAHAPHVQSYVLVTDHVGLSILRHSNCTTFRCHKNYNDAVKFGEIAASQSIIKANFEIASLQLKYRGVDFRKPENQQCNDRVCPIFPDGTVDGISHDPYELMFVKFKGAPPYDTDIEDRAEVYQQWLEKTQVAS